MSVYKTTKYKIGPLKFKCSVWHWNSKDRDTDVTLQRKYKNTMKLVIFVSMNTYYICTCLSTVYVFQVGEHKIQLFQLFVTFVCYQLSSAIPLDSISNEEEHMR